jgi:hypothetical protein
MGKESQDEEDWLGFDKLAKMLGEPFDDSPPKPEVPAAPPAETPTAPEKSPTDQDPMPEG